LREAKETFLLWSGLSGKGIWAERQELGREMDEHAAESARTKTVSRFSYEFVTDDVPSSPKPAQLTHPTRPEGTIQAG